VEEEVAPTGEEAAPAGKEVKIPVILQEGNNLPKMQFKPKRSNELADNSMGDMHGLRADIWTANHM